jgi:hypothetical protein
MTEMSKRDALESRSSEIAERRKVQAPSFLSENGGVVVRHTYSNVGITQLYLFGRRVRLSEGD